MQVRASDSDAFYSCHDTFSPVNASNSDLGGYPQVLLLKSRGRIDSAWSGEESLEGNPDFCLRNFSYGLHDFWGKCLFSPIFFSIVCILLLCRDFCSSPACHDEGQHRTEECPVFGKSTSVSCGQASFILPPSVLSVLEETEQRPSI